MPIKTGRALAILLAGRWGKHASGLVVDAIEDLGRM